MTSTSISRADHLEPPPWLYAWMAQGALLRLVYRRFVGDLAAALPAGACLLDVGTGPGYLLGYLAQARPDLMLFGLDLSHPMISRGRPRWPRPFPALVADAAALPFPPGSFDQVLATFSYHLWPQPGAGLQEILRVLKPRGRAWIYELNREATRRDLRQFAREERLPYPLVYLGYRLVSWHHALGAAAFRPILGRLPGAGWRLAAVHHLFWRAELEAG